MTDSSEHISISKIEHGPTKGIPDGYYLLGGCGEPQWCLVYLYDHHDFDGVRHIAYGRQDGGALMPVYDLRADAILVPAAVLASNKATKEVELSPNNVGESNGTE